MSETKSVIERFVDDRDSLSEDELASLVDDLERRPELAVELKEQLLLNELLSQQLGVDRRDFLAQIAQRVRDCDTGDEVLSSQVESLRSIAEEELNSWNARAERARYRKVIGALAAMLLIAVAGGLWYWLTRSVSNIAIVEVVLDGGQLTRDQITKRVNVGMDVLPGDCYETEAGQMLRFRYPDGTILQVGGNSIVRFPLTGRRQGKHVIVLRGDLSADVVPQSADRPMILHSPLADATVVGTSLTLAVRRDATWLDVSNGKVRLSRRGKQAAAVLVNSSHFGVITREAIHSEPVTWPVSREDLVFVFQTADKPNLVFDPVTQTWQRKVVEPQGQARFSDISAMQLTDGMFFAPAADKAVVMSCRDSNALSLQATIRPNRLDQIGPARIISLSSSISSYNFMIGQANDRLVARLRTTGGIESPVEFDLGGLTTGESTTFMLTFKPERFVCYINGEKRIDRQDTVGDFSNWVGQKLLFGNEADGSQPWAGTIEGVAIFNRFLDEDESKANVAEYRRLLRARETSQPD